MKKIEIKDLIIGEVYFKNNFIFKHVNTNPYLCDNYAIDELNNTYYHGNGHMKKYNEFPQRLATPEEKHWLETCIKADNFVSYEEALKTFIPEYVECIEECVYDYGTNVIGKIYKVFGVTPNHINLDYLIEYGSIKYPLVSKHRFKPSTKEAYDAQFVVKEPKVVLEEPKDKVIQTTSSGGKIRIDKVECSEGGVYQLGDKITVFTKDSQNKGRVLTIKGFRWNNAKTNICAITELHSKNGIGLDKIELYSKPVVKELSLLEQAKLKYPIGTEFKAARGNRNLYTVKSNDIFKENSDNAICIRENGNGTVYFNGEWAEIVEDFKLPEKWYVRRNVDNAEILNKWENNRRNQNVAYLKNNSCCMFSDKSYGHNKPKNLLGYTKITFEQFKKYVLKEETTVNVEEKVVEKDYEILSLIEDKFIYPCDKYSKDYINQLFNTLGVSIHSVKRLSDSEIFTIGDKVFTEYVNYTINKIGIVNDKCMVTALYDTNNPNGSRFHYNLNNLKKAKQPLFTTEQVKEIENIIKNYIK